MTITPSESRRTARRAVVGFCIVQILIISAGVGWSAYRYRSIVDRHERPVFSNEPVQIEPRYDVPEVVSDDQLVRVLTKLRPRLRGPRPKMNHVDHALRFWGIESQFDDPECLAGWEMRDLLLDHRQFAQAWGDKTHPFLISADEGIRVRTQEGLSTASHVDHTLASLAEAGVPLDFPVITAEGETALKSVLEQSLQDFSLNQFEYEWSSLAYALYLPETRSWISTEGQEITFDRLADRLMRQRLVQGVCLGNHRLHALVMLLRVDERFDILSEESRGEVIAHLQDVTRRFVTHQHADGHWEDAWPGVEADGPPLREDSGLDRLASRILVTGHVMEWWSLAPEEVQPPRETTIRAGQWLVTAIDDLSDSQVRAYYTYLTHAGRALSLWRGRFPCEVPLHPSAAE